MIDNITILIMGIAVLFVAFRAVRLERAERATRPDATLVRPSKRV